MWFDFTAAQTPPEEMGWQTQHCIGSPVESLKTWAFQTYPACASGGLRIQSVQCGCLPCPVYSMQAKITSRWRSLEAARGPLFTSPTEINKRWQFWLVLEPKVLQYMITSEFSWTLQCHQWLQRANDYHILLTGSSPWGKPLKEVFLFLIPDNIWMVISYKVKLCKPLLVNSASGLE